MWFWILVGLILQFFIFYNIGRFIGKKRLKIYPESPNNVNLPIPTKAKPIIHKQGRRKSKQKTNRLVIDKDIYWLEDLENEEISLTISQCMTQNEWDDIIKINENRNN